ncbi:MAG: thioredoxin [Thermoplasmata archaeon]|uniref:Thioredoxin n=1 Tax=Candidatus Sysuiplasma superficiale TaxID=2823368 RepID=A0A8J7YTR2_9ARCH|nr:thioredoxin [Candidatus Sysuiplasma superficiale]MBX8644332.1 thioredoxin [Candidatus Sysuiplasma superficiale]
MEELLRSAASPSDHGSPKAAGTVQVLSDQSFDTFINTNEVSFVDFWAPWCGPCRMVSPVVEQLARDYAGRVAFGKLNVDENPVISTRYNVMSIPTLLIFRKGRNVDSIIGAQSRSAIAARINRHIQSR